MAYDGLNGPTSRPITSELTDEVSHVSELPETSIVVEGGPHGAFLPMLLRSCADGIRGATRQALDDGRSIITARTSRDRLIAALSSIPGVKLVEV